MWYRSGSQIKGLADKCLDVQWGVAANGTPVHMWPCNGGAAQQWNFPSDGTIRVFGFCLEPEFSNPTPGAMARIAYCNGSAAQRWSWSNSDPLVDPIYSVSTGVGAASTSMIPFGDGFCFLQRVSGEFQIQGDVVEVKATNDGRWSLSSQAVVSAVYAQSRCVGWSRFANVARYQQVNLASTLSTSSTQNIVPIGTSDKIHLLAKMAGEFDGGAEHVQVAPYTDGTGRFYVGSGSLSPSGVVGKSYSMQLFDSAGAARAVRYVGRFGSTAPSAGGATDVRLIDTAQGVCYLARIGGAFRGGAESVEVFRSGGFWWLRAAAGRINSGVHAHAECIAFNP